MDCCSFCPCCPEEEEPKDKHSSVKYQKASEMNIDVVLPQYEKVPLDKVFEYKQPRVPMPVHPQISGYSAITEQPSPSVTVTAPSPSGQAKIIGSDKDGKHLDSKPLLHFSLYYDIQRRTLTVHLMEGTNLPAKDRRGTSDPFVILFLLPNKEEIFESKVHKRTLDPIFNEVFEFSGLLPNEIRRQTLVLRVLDKDLASSEDMGTVVLQLEEADLYGVRVSAPLAEVPTGLMQNDSQGDVLISLMYNPSSNIISGVLLKATNLQRMDISGSSDPYVKIYLLHKGTRQAKWKSTIKKKTLVPIYNEQFQFDVTDMNISFILLEVSVMDYDRLGRNDLMGFFTLGEGANHPSGRQHWQEMVSHPRNPISRWHALGAKNTNSLRRGSSGITGSKSSGSLSSS
ncbi:PREDICTED: synaptotagmin-10-like [Amphimedon queenslandica]|uniref:C2 domain-containing protein n=2 Tax=Amphimedon queenslandica TaxID=400682 RepID=A0A1X7UWH3_AMPQE|nr:PREDICTED: synaptotagmin-10-like [Amphimedon queenslandica]XP_019851871.1 PREDICTED: synaptotagmin-10-like [Amphimedon queenslandica]|eukprot:XP_003386572.1 PREDICTED: synaptotagmin-10-like [Amphimedon queenslandica]